VDADKHQFGDELSANITITHLKAAAAEQRPFFVACGFHRPHLPWSVPKRFYDMQPAVADVAPPVHPAVPIGSPPIAWHSIPGPGFPTQQNITLPQNEPQANRRAYYAAVSFMDHQVGRVLTELDSLGLSDSTIVVFTADHGWQLGEMNM
jgi:arylsulfatase A-like enzyme